MVEPYRAPAPRAPNRPPVRVRQGLAVATTSAHHRLTRLQVGSARIASNFSAYAAARKETP